ncbi:hypothetical protein FO519_006639 [Halicephalobus sp. NKZ332]|nr:hypothetical protein FO519_006639 [Halicephalobus sp. NKZ332]
MEEFLKLLLLAVVLVQGSYGYERKSPSIVCVNGTVVSGKCNCNSGYIGDYCELKVNCASHERNPNGSCKSCKEHFNGTFCEEIQCTNGKPEDQKCVCEKPYSGEFCDKLTTEDVYLYYNKRMTSAVGILGALTIIPLIMVYYGCEYMARKRQVKRIGQQVSENQNVSVDSQAVKNLLVD